MPSRRGSKRKSPKAAKPEADVVLDAAGVKGLTVALLKVELEKRGVDKKELKVKKAVLVERLLELIQSAGTEEAEAEPAAEPAEETPAAPEETKQVEPKVEETTPEEPPTEAPAPAEEPVQEEAPEKAEVVAEEAPTDAGSMDVSQDGEQTEAVEATPTEDKAADVNNAAEEEEDSEKNKVVRAAGTKLEGTVKWFEIRKGFGFLHDISDGGRDVFFHSSSINTDSDPKVIVDNMEVQFVWQPDKEPKAGKKKHAGGRALDICARGGGKITLHDSLLTPEFRKRLKAHPDIKLGIVKWFHQSKGYGFVAPSDGSKDVFIHMRDLKVPPNLPNKNLPIPKGTPVEYKLAPAPEAPASEEVKENAPTETEASSTSSDSKDDETAKETTTDTTKETNTKGKKPKLRGVEVTGPGGSFVGFTVRAPSQGHGGGRGRGRGGSPRNSPRGRGSGRGAPHFMRAPHWPQHHPGHQFHPGARGGPPLMYARPHFQQPMHHSPRQGALLHSPAHSPRHSQGSPRNAQPQHMYPRSAGGLPSYSAGVNGGFQVSSGATATSAWASIQAQGQQVRGQHNNRKRHGGPMQRKQQHQRARHA